MTTTVHIHPTECRHHCDHVGGNVSIAWRDRVGNSFYMNMPRDVAMAVLDAFNEATDDHNEKLRTYSREQLIAEDV